MSFLIALPALAQTTAFSYQGKLTDAGNPATGAFQMQFRLFDSSGGAGQVGSTLTDVPVTVLQGIFSVRLDFGAAALPGANRWLEIAVRRNSGESYTTLSPREQIASSPYAVRTLSAATADLATNASQLGGLPANQYLQTNGNGSGLTNLNASSISTGTLDNARLGQIPTANIADNAVTAAKVAPGQVVKGLNGLTDNVTLAAGSNITVTPSGNTLTIASSGSGVGGSGTAGNVPLWSGGTLLGNSVISQGNSNRVNVGTPSSPELIGALNAYGTPGLSTVAIAGRQQDSGFAGVAGIGPTGVYGQSNQPSGVGVAGEGSATQGIGVLGTGATGVRGEGTGSLGVGVSGVGATGMLGTTTSGIGVRASAVGVGSIALRADGSSWFRGDTTALSATQTGPGEGIVVGSTGGFGYIQAFDYGVFQSRNLTLNKDGGNVGINTNAPTLPLDVNGRARIRMIPLMGTQTIGVCFNALGDLLQCSGSSMKWKTNVHALRSGLNTVLALRPITFNWKDGGQEDLGLGAEDVARVAPELALIDDKGEAKGVKYEKINLLLINAVKEQQTLIETQRRRIDALKRLVCKTNRRSEICRRKNQ